MSEVEKMYENAGINVEPICNNCNRLDENWNNGSYNSTCKDDKSKYECDKVSLVYPPFTPEKQLSLIKWLAKHYGNIHILNNAARGMAIGIEGVSFNLKKFGETIAMVLNTLWQDLTEQERTEIRSILNG